MNTTNQTRREIMKLAWGLFRAEANGPNPRTFADALAGAWRWIKGAAARLAAAPRWTQGTQARTVSFGTMLQSPIRRRVGSGWSAYKAERVTAAVGA
jgi:hypothetical protein